MVYRYAVFAVLLAAAGAPLVVADTFQSTNYTIDASVVGNSTGGTQTSTNYSLVSSAGESIIGDAAGGSYKLGIGYVAQLDKSLQLNVQPANQVAYYPLDEGAGTAAWDNSANQINGKLMNTPTSVAGKIGQGLSFNGTNQYVNVPTNAALDFTTSFTAELWIKTASTNTGYMGLLTKYTSTPAGWDIALQGGCPRVTIRGTSSIDTGSGWCASSLQDNAWHHIVAVATTTSLKVYIDGVLKNTTNGTWTPTTASAFDMQIGSRQGSVYYEGAVDEVKLFSRALSSEEVAAEYTAQNAGNSAGVSFAGGITPGASNTSGYDAVVQTDAPGYNLAINQNQNLTSGANTIAAISGASIATPLSWSEGTTKGLGFTLYGTNATAIPAKWSSGSAYAPLPGTATTFYSRTGYTGGAKDYLNMRLRLDVPKLQATGLYTNQMTITGTLTP